jgi:hypothetical protein
MRSVNHPGRTVRFWTEIGPVWTGLVLVSMGLFPTTPRVRSFHGSSGVRRLPAVVRCKRCGNPLIMTSGGKCRFCGARAGLLRAMAGKTTYTRRGAERYLSQLEQKALSAALARTEAASASPAARPVLANLTWQQAEQLSRDWMAKHGYRDAMVTPSGPDGGVDVVARKAIAQVKHQAKPVALAEVQRLYGVAKATKKKALFFSAAGYTPVALKWATDNGVECYQYPPVRRAEVRRPSR